MPYQVLGVSAGALALMIAWSRLPVVRSGSFIWAIFASTALSPSTSLAAAFSSRTRSFAAAFSSAVNPLDALPVALLADFFVPFVAAFFSAIPERHLLSVFGKSSKRLLCAHVPAH